MATLTIRNLPDDVRDKLRVRAAEKGRSMEAEVRSVLAEAVIASSTDVSMTEWNARVRGIQERVAKYIPKGSYTVDDFLAERRAEAAQAEARWDRLEREAAEAARQRATKNGRG